MKRDLFYTFLSIYILTAIVTILGLIGILTIADKYMGMLVPTVILETVVAVIALFKGAKFFEESVDIKTDQTVSFESLLSISSPDKKHIQPKPVENVISELSTNKSSSQVESYKEDIVALSRKESPTLEEYFKVYAGLKHRFKESSKYTSNMENKNVIWQGVVDNISNAQNDLIALSFSSPKTSKLQNVVAFFPKDMEVDLFSLNKGDFVEIEGTLNLRMPSMPSIDAKKISLLKI